MNKYLKIVSPWGTACPQNGANLTGQPDVVIQTKEVQTKTNLVLLCDFDHVFGPLLFGFSGPFSVLAELELLPAPLLV